MLNGILGYKRGMTRIFGEDGTVIPVTVIEAGPCPVTQIKTVERDGYSAVQLGFGDVKRLTQAEAGHLRASKAEVKHLREFRVEDPGDLAVGSTVGPDLFETGQKVHVTGVSRGLGFAGTVKRHNFGRQRKTHGQTDRERAPGAIGAGSTPGRTFKGKRMAGRMGGERVTVKNLEVVVADGDRNLLAVRGSVPGHDGTLLIVQAAG